MGNATSVPRARVAPAAPAVNFIPEPVALPPAAPLARRAGEAAAEPAIAFGGVGKRFALSGGDRAVSALEDVSFEVGRDEFTCVVGPSGCGKSTLLKLVAGLVRPDRGTVRALGRDVQRPHPSRGMVFQDHALFPWLDVARNVAFGLELAGVPRAEVEARVREFVALTGLSGFERAYPHELSGGMKQRVGIARVLAMHPEVLLMDEPFGSLDAFTRCELQDELQSLRRRAPCATLFVTHDVEEAVYLADRIVVMSRRPGRVKAIVPVLVERPRRRSDPEFVRVRERVLELYDHSPTARDREP